MKKLEDHFETIAAPGLTKAHQPHTESLRSKAARGIAWSTIGVIGDYAFRLVSSLILTRLLFPEAFGVVATMSILFIALGLFSDIGLVQAIVQLSHGEEARYLNTAWTLQLVRGFLLAGFAVALAYPFASFYREPILFPVILVVSIGPILRGFRSPVLFLLKRRLEVRRLAIMELICSVIRIAATIAATLVLRNVWALVLGGLFGEFLLLIASYMVWPYRPHLHLDRTAAREILRFGRFILLSGILGFLTMRLDVVLIPRYLGMDSAGIYAIAVNIALILSFLLDSVVDRVIYPIFCQLKDDFDHLRARQHELLETYCSLVVPMGLLVAANAEVLIQVLYDPRYAEAGKVLCWLLVAGLIQSGCRLLNSSIMATGRSYVGTIASFSFLVCLCVALPLLAPRWQMQGYAAAKMLGSLGFLFPVILYARRLQFATYREYVRCLRVPFVTLQVLIVIRLTGRFWEASLWKILEPMFVTVAVGVILLIWQRTLLIKVMDQFGLSVPPLAALIKR